MAIDDHAGGRSSEHRRPDAVFTRHWVGGRSRIQTLSSASNAKRPADLTLARLTSLKRDTGNIFTPTILRLTARELGSWIATAAILHFRGKCLFPLVDTDLPIYRVVQKTDPLTCFCNNFGKCTPILVLFSLLQQENYGAQN